MSTATEIANDALVLVNQAIIADIDAPTSKAGRLCQRMFPNIRKRVYREYPFNCLLRRVALSPLEDAPAFEYEYAFELPKGCMRVFRIYDEGMQKTNNWKVEDGKVLWNGGTVLYLQYVADITDYSKIDPSLRQLLVYALARDLCIPLIGKKSTMTMLDGLYQECLDQSTFSDSVENPADDPVNADMFVNEHNW